MGLALTAVIGAALLNTKITQAQATQTAGIKAAPSICGALHVDGTKLMDSQGNVVQLKGISTHGIAWYLDYINKDCFRELYEKWGANVIRLAMYTAESGGYCTDGDKETLKKLVKDGVSYATENDMYVIVDWHILSDNNPNMYIEEAKDFFAEMSREFADYNNVLYEICNEPNGQTTWTEIKAYAAQIIPIIRKNTPDAIILVGTPNWSQFVDQAAANPITEYDNLMYTLHFYAATHKDDLRTTMTSAIDAGLPVFVSEYGICDASGNGIIDEPEANRWVETMNAYDVSYVAWNMSNKNESSCPARLLYFIPGAFHLHDVTCCLLTKSQEPAMHARLMTAAAPITVLPGIPPNAPETMFPIFPNKESGASSMASWICGIPSAKIIQIAQRLQNAGLPKRKRSAPQKPAAMVIKIAAGTPHFRICSQSSPGSEYRWILPVSGSHSPILTSFI